VAENKLMEVLRAAAQRKASDVHVALHQRPKIRIDSRLLDTDFDVVSESMLESFLEEVTSSEKLQTFKKTKEMDFSFNPNGVGFCRGNLYYQRGKMGLAIRLLPSRIWSFEDCGHPEGILTRLCEAPTGLVLVTGATGSGKTTTMASMVDHVNQTRPCHIITLEDPIEYMFENKMAKVDQREIGRDTESFSGALKYILRQDPDIVLIGEMRDHETMEAALNIAETGHLVMATLHTTDAIQTINRIIDVFPDYKQHQVRVQLSFVLNAVLCQRLIPKTDGGRVMALEIMIANQAIRSMIRDGKTHLIYSAIQTGKREGMKSMNQSLADLIMEEKIPLDEAANFSSDVRELLDLVQGGSKKSNLSKRAEALKDVGYEL